jgi:hypothetical protein
MRRLLFVVVALFALLAPGRAFATTPPNSGDTSDSAAATTTTIDNSFLDTKRQLTECLNNSIDLPDCGIEPKVAGDRGGVLQGVTFGLLTLGIAIISWRVVRAVRARDAAVGSRAA